MNPGDDWIAETFTPDDVWQHRVTKVLARAQTRFQEMSIVQSGAYGKALVLDGRWQTCTGDEFLYHEPLVHTPLVMHPNPHRVLIAGGADGGAAREALKWKSVEEILLVDIDGEVVDACRAWLPEIHQGSLDDPRVRIEIDDAFDVIEHARDWDVIIADLTDPIESGPAFKLFTQEFFAICRRALIADGVFINQSGSMSPPLLGPLARTAKTIGSVFANTSVVTANVPTYGSAWGLVLASDQRLNLLPDAKQIDDRLDSELSAPLRMFDGRTLIGMLQTPKHVRDRIECETLIYTLKRSK